MLFHSGTVLKCKGLFSVGPGQASDSRVRLCLGKGCGKKIDYSVILGRWQIWLKVTEPQPKQHCVWPSCSVVVRAQIAVRTLNSLSLPRWKVPEDTSIALSLWRPGLDPTPSSLLTGGCGRMRG